MLTKIVTLALLAGPLFFSTGCAKDTHSDFGQSVRQVCEAQKINPLPPAADPVTGLEGPYAAGVMQSWQKTGETGRQDNSAKFESVIESFEGSK